MALLFLSFLTGTAFAQTPDRLVKDIRTDAGKSCVTVTYSLSAIIDEVKIEDEGTVVAQDDQWFLKGQSVEIYTCADGTWILSPESKEVIVEPKWTYDDLEAFYKTLVKASSSNDVQIKVLNRTLSDKKPVEYFIPKTDDDWVVTDLR